MGTIWFLSKERNMLITGFNKVEKDNQSELWVKEIDGSSRRVATGKEADELENALLDIAWGQFPSIISDGRGKFATNVKYNTEIEEEVE